MPSASRSRSAAAVIDGEISDRAEARGVHVTPGRVRRWRLGGLLPQLDAVGGRPPGAPPGRLPRQYSSATLIGVDSAIDVLVRHARRGRSQHDLALILFAHQLPIEAQLVRAAIAARLDSTQSGLAELSRTARTRFPAPADPGLGLDEGFERAESLAQLALAERSSSVSHLRRNLKSSGRPLNKANLLQITTHFFRLLGATEASGNTEEDGGLSLDLMRALGMDGMLGSAASDVPPLLPHGANDFLDAAKAVGQFALQPLPSDLSDDELFAARDLANLVAQALNAIPDPRILHHLGGPALSNVWDPSDPILIATVTTLLVHVQRHDGILDPSPLVDAIRAQGWLPPTIRGSRRYGVTARGVRVVAGRGLTHTDSWVTE